MKRLLEAVDAPSRARPWAFLLLAAALAAVDLRAGVAPDGEGVMLQWGHRIAEGQWPYRDFWMDVLPGQALLQAALGDSLVGWRVLRVATGALAALVAYLLVRREAGERWAVGAFGATALALAWPLTPGPAASAVALALGALLLARRSPAGGGAVAGVCALFRPELGLAAALGVVLTARQATEAAPGAGAAAAPAAAADARGAVGPAPAPRAAAPAAAAAGVFLAGLAPFLVVAPGGLLSQVTRPLADADTRWLALPLDPGTWHPGDVLERLFPTVLVAACVVWAASALPARRALVLAPLVAVGLLTLLARADAAQYVPLAAVLPVAIALAGAAERRRPVQALLAACLGLVTLHGLERLGGHVHAGSQMVAVDLPGASAVRTTPRDARALAELATAVDRHAPRGAPVFVVPPQFDRVREGNPLLYVLLGRENPTRFDAMRAGVVTTLGAQREMRAALERARTPVVVRWVAPAAREREHNASGRSSGVHVLDDFLRAAYRLTLRVGDYELLVRRS